MTIYRQEHVPWQFTSGSYLWILLQFQCLLINILASVRNHYPWINRTWVFTNLRHMITGTRNNGSTKPWATWNNLHIFAILT
nr:Os02g0797425 [Ipomoea batatas]